MDVDTAGTMEPEIAAGPRTEDGTRTGPGTGYGTETRSGLTDGQYHQTAPSYENHADLYFAETGTEAAKDVGVNTGTAENDAYAHHNAYFKPSFIEDNPWSHLGCVLNDDEADAEDYVLNPEGRRGAKGGDEIGIGESNATKVPLT